jgi:uncharacterized membrane protein (Fun14 family)
MAARLFHSLHRTHPPTLHRLFHACITTTTIPSLFTATAARLPQQTLRRTCHPVFKRKTVTILPPAFSTAIVHLPKLRPSSLIQGATLSLTSSVLFTHFLSTPAAAECAASNASNNDDNNPLKAFDFQTIGMAAGVGAVPGFCAGFMFRKLGNVAIFFVGSTFCMFQCAAYKGYVTIHWERVEEDLKSLMQSKEVGAVMNPEQAEQKMNDVVQILTPNTTNGAMGGFGMGFLAGLKLG